MQTQNERQKAKGTTVAAIGSRMLSFTHENSPFVDLFCQQFQESFFFLVRPSVFFSILNNLFPRIRFHTTNTRKNNERIDRGEESQTQTQIHTKRAVSSSKCFNITRPFISSSSSLSFFFSFSVCFAVVVFGHRCCFVHFVLHWLLHLCTGFALGVYEDSRCKFMHV